MSIAVSKKDFSTMINQVLKLEGELQNFKEMFFGMITMNNSPNNQQLQQMQQMQPTQQMQQPNQRFNVNGGGFGHGVLAPKPKRKPKQTKRKPVFTIDW